MHVTRGTSLVLALIALATAGPLHAQDAAAPGAGGDTDRALIQAARDGQLEQVRALLAQGANASAANPAGRTPLIAAAYFGNQRVVSLLIAEGVNVDAADTAGARGANVRRSAVCFSRGWQSELGSVALTRLGSSRYRYWRSHGRRRGGSRAASGIRCLFEAGGS